MTSPAHSKTRFGNVEVQNIFISAGCNRVVNAAAWGPANLVAFGAHHAVAVFCTQTAEVVQTLPGHKDLVNCVEWLPRYQLDHKDGITPKEQYLLSGSADGVIILWAVIQSKNKWRKVMQIPNPHEKAVSCIAGVMLSSQEAVFASSSSDCTVHIWNALLPLEVEGECNITFLQSILTGSRAVMAVSLVVLPIDAKNIMLAMGGLENNVRLYCGTRDGQFTPVCTLKGHQDWIRSLDFSLPIFERDAHAIFLASCGQDKNVRIWRISPRNSSICTGANKEQVVSIKTYIEGPVFKAGSVLWQASMESLLAGHDDWVYSVRWQPPSFESVQKGPQKLACRVQPMSILTASMDRTMMIWRPDASTGLWMNEVTVGELGHTALGFYGGMWSSGGDAILAHAFGGSFHMWRNFGSQNADWQPQLVPSGHSGSVSDVSWAKEGQFLLSASHDQTTRLFAPWDWSKLHEARKVVSWHEIARPQVHGHDLNCLAVLRGVGNHHCVSGAEEKVARVFEAPGAFLKTLERIKGYTGASTDTLRAEDVKILGANMSALSLSQKPIYSQGGQSTKAAGLDVESMETVPDALPAELTEPPLEEHVAWNTLWPESHKLYGHGNELFSMCCDHHGQFLATSCKAQSASVAEIWLWQIGSWRAAGQLQSHTLTVTQMEFSHNDNYLLSVSRDRQFSLFQASKTNAEPPYKLVSRVEAHKRIIWACSWSPCDRFFATGSRDKSVKLWVVEDRGGTCTVMKAGNLPPFKSSVTALSWAPETSCGEYLLATGTEEGLLQLWKVRPILVNRVDEMHDVSSCPEKIDSFEISCLFQFDEFSCHVASVNRLAWKEKSNDKHERQEECLPFLKEMQLASCGADHTVRLFNLKC